jgi:hypothetical protein
MQDQDLRFDQDLEDWILLLLLLLPFKNSSEHDTMREVHASESEEAKTEKSASQGGEEAA